jgi:DNA gyrase subunit A
VREFSAGAFVVMATRRGVIKKTALTAFANIRAAGIIALSIDEDDDLVDVRITEGTHDILLCTAAGKANRFAETDVRPMGRTARGVRGIRLRGQGDRVVAMAVVRTDSPETLLTVCARGYGKRTLLADFPRRGRGGLGVIAIRASERNGEVVGVRIVSNDDDIMLVTDRGKVIRMRVADLPTIGRATQGVRLIRTEEGESVVAIERLAEKEDSAAEAVAPAEQPTGEAEFENGEEASEEAAEEEGAEDDQADDLEADDPEADDGGAEGEEAEGEEAEGGPGDGEDGDPRGP